MDRDDAVRPRTKDDPTYQREYQRTRYAADPEFRARRLAAKRRHRRREAREARQSRRWRAALVPTALSRLKAAGWSQPRIAAALGVTEGTVSNWQRGVQVPYARHADALWRLAEAQP